MDGHAAPQGDPQAVIDRFVAACEADARVVAAFLGGSYARGAADAYSDVDLGVITTDAGYADFVAGGAAFIRLLGTPLFLEAWAYGDLPVLFFILAEGTDGELMLGRVSHFARMHVGLYRVLVDKQGLLAGVAFPPPVVDPAEQVETLRGLMTWFWHDLAHHFITPLARGELWGAYGGLEDLRRACVNLARLGADFAAEATGYEKVEQALPVATLAPLAASLGPPDRAALLAAARGVIGFYEALAPGLAAAHGLPYPAELARLLVARLDAVGAGG